MNSIKRARAAFLRIWPSGVECNHDHAKEGFIALDEAQELLQSYYAHIKGIGGTPYLERMQEIADHRDRLAAEVKTLKNILRQVAYRLENVHSFRGNSVGTLVISPDVMSEVLNYGRETNRPPG